MKTLMIHESSNLAVLLLKCPFLFVPFFSAAFFITAPLNFWQGFLSVRAMTILPSTIKLGVERKQQDYCVYVYEILWNYDYIHIYIYIYIVHIIAYYCILLNIIAYYCILLHIVAYCCILLHIIAYYCIIYNILNYLFNDW